MQLQISGSAHRSVEAGTGSGDDGHNSRWLEVDFLPQRTGFGAQVVVKKETPWSVFMLTAILL
jgi:hypothetical protein